MNIFAFITVLIIIGLVLAGGTVALVVRGLIGAGKYLTNWVSRKPWLPPSKRPRVIEAEDVVVEDAPPAPSEYRRQTTSYSRPAPAQQDTDYDYEAANRSSYVHLNVNDGDGPDEIIAVLRDLSRDPVVGGLANSAIHTLRSTEMRQRNLRGVIDDTFEPRTISWAKFESSASAAYDAILQNSALLANRLQAFDSAGYLQLARETNASNRLGTGARSQRWQLMQNELLSLSSLQESNENLLLEMDKLASELTGLSADEASAESESILSEIHRLVDDAKYYR